MEMEKDVKELYSASLYVVLDTELDCLFHTKIGNGLSMTRGMQAARRDDASSSRISSSR
jgi:hypothetical protein